MPNFAWSGLKVSQLGVTNTHSIRRETYHFNWLHTRTGAFLKFLKKNLSKWVHHREVFSSAFNLVTLKLPQVIGPLWSCPSQVSSVGTSLARHLPHSPFCTLSCSTSTSLLYRDHTAVISFPLCLKGQNKQKDCPKVFQQLTVCHLSQVLQEQSDNYFCPTWAATAWQLAAK